MTTVFQRPLHKRLRFESKLLERCELTPTVSQFSFFVPENFVFTAGQYVTISFSAAGKVQARSYSICSSPSQKSRISCCIKKVEAGMVTPALFNFPLGMSFRIVGPMGFFVLPKQMAEHNLVFIATGTGISPIKSQIETLLLKDFKNKLTLLTGARYIREILYKERFLALSEARQAAKKPPFVYESIVSRPENPEYSGEQGRVLRLLEKHYSSNEKSLFFICGLKAMVDDIRNLLRKLGTAEQNIFFEKYDA